MIKVDCPALSAPTQRLLRNRGRRGTRWSSRNPARVAGDCEISETLQTAFHSKCGYCEKIEARTIDHFWPKRKPDDNGNDRTWDWDNYIWSCDACQSKKSERLPRSDQGHFMVNPRTDEPLSFVRTESDSGKVVAVPIAGPAEQRGLYTIAVLALEQRPDLDRERSLMLERVLDLLNWIADPESSQATIDHAWERLQQEVHQGRPFLMVIQQLFTNLLPEYAPLVDALYRIKPEAWELLAWLRRPVALVPEVADV